MEGGLERRGSGSAPWLDGWTRHGMSSGLSRLFSTSNPKEQPQTSQAYRKIDRTSHEAHESLLRSQAMINHPNYQIQPKSIYKVEAVHSLGETALGSQDTARNAQQVPSIVPVPIPCPLDQVLRPIFSLSPLQNLLDVKILVALNLLSCGSNP